MIKIFFDYTIMGNVIDKIVHSKCTFAITITKETLQFTVTCVKKSLRIGNTCLDFISDNLTDDKPTYELVNKRLEMPKKTYGVVETMLQVAPDIATIPLIPLKFLNDKKFTTHAYESSHVHQGLMGVIETKNEISCGDKLLIYIASHKDNILEPYESFALRNVSINNNNYDLPCDSWLTFKIDNKNCIYFYTYISIVQAYHGLLLATHKKHSQTLTTFKEKGLNYYNVSMGNVITDLIINDL